jgi:hypothetical protein
VLLSRGQGQGRVQKFVGHFLGQINFLQQHPIFGEKDLLGAENVSHPQDSPPHKPEVLGVTSWEVCVSLVVLEVMNFAISTNAY